MRSLSRRLPTPEEFGTIINSLDSMDARAAALVLAAIVETHLEAALRWTFVPMSSLDNDRLFEGLNAALGTFSAKIALGHAVGLYHAEFRGQLDSFRAIRNAFAHSMVMIEFDEPLIAAECEKLKLERLIENFAPDPGTPFGPRERFTTFGAYAGGHLQQYITRRMNGLRDGSIPVPTPLHGRYGKPPPDGSQSQD